MDGYYGDTCNKQCGDNCRHCDKSSGRCMAYHGDVGAYAGIGVLAILVIALAVVVFVIWRKNLGASSSVTKESQPTTDRPSPAGYEKNAVLSDAPNQADYQSMRIQ